MNVVTKTIARLDAFQRRRKFLGFPLAVLKKYGEDEAGHQAALLAYYGFLAIFPLLLALTSILKLVVRGNNHMRQSIVQSVTDYMPIVGSDLQQNVHGLGATGVALVIGTVLTVFGARGVADALRSGINHVWQIPYMRRTGFPHNILKSLLSMVVFGVGLVLAPLISGYAISVGGHGLPIRLLTLLITSAILFGVFLTLVRIALPMRVRSRELWPAAALATVGLMILQLVGSYVLTHQLKHLSSLYGTFAIVLGLLYWLYLQSQVFFYALETASVRALQLWPRALDQSSLTAADRRAFRLYALRNRFHASEEITVTTKKTIS